jgi:hypothetical protein
MYVDGRDCKELAGFHLERFALANGLDIFFQIHS